MIKEYLNKSIIPVILSIIFTGILKNTVFDKTTERIDKDDFSIIEANITPDSTKQIKTYFIKNNSNFPINNSNFKINYTSDVKPIYANFTSSNGDCIQIKLNSKSKSVIQTTLPTNLANEDFFSISIHYPFDCFVNDKLIIKIESKKDDEYINLENESQKIESYLNRTLLVLFNGKTLIVIESFLILYFILFQLVNFILWLWNFRKQQEDKKFYNDRNKKHFLK